MIALTSIRSTLDTYIGASSTFASYSVLVDDGYQHDEIEAALRDDGVVVVIGPFTDITPLVQEAGYMRGAAALTIMLNLNPVVNAALDTPLSMDALLSSLLATVIGITPEPDNDRFRIAGVSLTTTEDQGPYRYEVRVTKGILIAL